MPTASCGEETAGGLVTDTIVLTIPTGSTYRAVASLVLGGVGSRLDLPYERVDDLQLAVLSMLDASEDDEASVEISAEDSRLAVSVGPLRPGAESDEGLALVLRRLTDGVEAWPRDGSSWMTVFLARARPAARGSESAQTS
jgi:hypothetical protein